MKKIFLFIVGFVLFISSANALEIDDNEFFTWLINNDLVVNDNNIEAYSTSYPNITKGSVFLNYDLINKELYRPRELMISTALMGDSLLYAYNITKDSRYLNDAILIGNNIIDNCIYENKYPRFGLEDPDLTMVVSQKSLINSSWGYNIEPEIYMNIMLFIF